MLNALRLFAMGAAAAAVVQSASTGLRILLWNPPLQRVTRRKARHIDDYDVLISNRAYTCEYVHFSSPHVRYF